MARQKGIIKLTGKVGDLSFYKSKDGFLAREKGGVEGNVSKTILPLSVLVKMVWSLVLLPAQGNCFVILFVR